MREHHRDELPLGERTEKTVNDQTAYFHHGENGEQLYERDAQGRVKEYVWFQGKPIARIDDGVIYRYHADHLGTPPAR